MIPGTLCLKVFNLERQADSPPGALARPRLATDYSLVLPPSYALYCPAGNTSSLILQRFEQIPLKHIGSFVIVFRTASQILLSDKPVHLGP